MTSARDPISSDVKAERLLASLEGVVSAHVVAEAGGKLVEIHVLSTPDLHPKQVVRNVESALRAGLGISIDRRIVSVAQVRSPQADFGNGQAAAPAVDGGTSRAAAEESRPARGAPEPRHGLERLEYVRFSSRRDEEYCTCEVILRDSRGEFTGTGSGPDTAGGRGEAAARAVLDAIQQARPELRIELEGAAISSSRGRGYLIISARALLDRMTVPLAGAAPLARSPEEAAILATLQATNRWSA